jgi:hypothetical protein
VNDNSIGLRVQPEGVQFLDWCRSNQ